MANVKSPKKKTTRITKVTPKVLTDTKETKPPLKGRLTPKRKLFAFHYANTLNGVQSAKKAYNATNTNSANVIAVDNLQLPTVKNEIERILNGLISDDDLLALHLRNAKQNKHLPTSQKAIESLEELKGIKSKEEQQSNGNVTVNIVGVFKDD